MEKSFPKCPICESSRGYSISGILRKYAQCDSCKAKWRLHFKGGEITGLTLHELPKNGQALYQVDLIRAPLYTMLGKEYQTDFWSKMKLAEKIDWKYMRGIVPAQVANAVILGRGEKILASWEGYRLTRRTIQGTTRYTDEKQNGNLILTNRRMLWTERRTKTKGTFFKSTETSFLVKSEIPLVDIKGVSGSSGDRSDWMKIPSEVRIVDSKGEYMFLIYYGFYEIFKPAIEYAISLRQEEIESDKRKERVQLVLDFSSLKDYMEKGGLVMQTFRCPHCNAPVEFPEGGKTTKCAHCSSRIYARDIFEKIKELIG